LTKVLREVAGAQGQAHPTLHGGHFIQEDDPQRFAELVIAACGQRQLRAVLD
jgi:haloalkane dehalogenase